MKIQDKNPMFKLEEKHPHSSRYILLPLIFKTTERLCVYVCSASDGMVACDKQISTSNTILFIWPPHTNKDHMMPT